MTQTARTTAPAVTPQLGVGAFPDALMLPGAQADEAIARYNRWVRDPESDAPDEVASGLGAYAPLVDVVAYTVGLRDTPPTVTPDAPADLRAVVASAQAAAFVERDELVAAATLLQTAADDVRDSSPILAGSLYADAGGQLRQAGRDDEAVLALETALELLTPDDDHGKDDDQREARATIHHEIGNIAHERLLAAGEPLQRAMNHYYAGLQLVSEQSAPQTWAALQLDLATAQLATPMQQATDQLRIGIAAQSLRAARRIFDQREQPNQWASATVNLAGALVYLPSTHQEDNLVEAVDLYEEVLVSGIRGEDVASTARLLANQGNALAHLGVFDRARAKLAEARYLFESVLDHDGAAAVRSVLDEIAKAGVSYDANAEAADLIRQSGQMARMPDGMGEQSGIGVTVIPPDAQRRANVRILPKEQP